MSISSITPSTPVNPPATVSAPPTPNVNTDSDGSDTQAARATVPAPLPPGQGTRVDQFV